VKANLITAFFLVLLGHTLHCGVVLEDVFKPEMLLVGDKYIYVAEGWQIKIFNRLDGKRFGAFGRRGEGPGEFNGYIIPSLTDRGIFVSCPARVLYFDREGTFLRERRALKVFGRYKPMGKNFVGYRYLREESIHYETVCLYNGDFQLVRELYRRKHIRQPDGSTDLVNERPPFFHVSQGKIYLDGIDGYIHVFSHGGEPLGRIPGTENRVPFTSRHRHEMEEALKRDKRTRDYYYANKDKFVWPKYQPMIRMFYLADGRFYILTSREKQGKMEMLIRSLKGDLLGRKYVAVTSFPQALLSDVREGRLYRLAENVDGDWELRITNLMNPPAEVE